MIQNIEKGKGFGGAIRYAMEKIGGRRIGGSMIGQNPATLIKEAGKIRGLNPKLGRAVFHTSLAVSPDDNLNDDQWNEIADKYLEGMGFENAAHVVVRHTDTEHDHIHIVALRIDTKTGKTIDDAKDFEKGAKILQQIELDYGLIAGAQTPSEARSVERKSLSKSEIEMALRTGEKPSRLILQDAIDELLKEPISAVEFAEALSDAGIDVIANMSINTGKMSGFSFAINGVAFTGTNLGAGYKWSGLQKRGLTYEQTREGESLARFARARQGEDNQRISGNGEGAVPVIGIADGRNEGIINSASTSLEQSGIINEGAGFQNGIDLDRSARIDTAVPANVRRSTDTKRHIDELEATGAAEAEIYASGDFVGSERDAINSIRDMVSEVADMAAPVKTGEISKDHQAKIDAWHKQSGALGAPFYRVTCVGRGENTLRFNLGKDKSGGAEKFWSAAEVEGMIPRLRRENARGFDIYITPVDRDYHYILIDDVTEANIPKIKVGGYAPALIQKSSDDNKQVIIKAERDSQRDSKNEQSLANMIVVDLNMKKGWGDPKISAAQRPFRMAGFSNKKPGKNNFFTAIVESAGVVCKKTSKKLKKMRGFFDLAEASRKKNKEYKRRYDAVIEQIDQPIINGGEIEMSYKRRMALALHLVESRGWTLDLSRVDYRVAKDLIRADYDLESIKKAMLAVSPAIYDRKHNPIDYVERTVLAANSSDDVINWRAAKRVEEELKLAGDHVVVRLKN